MKALVTGATGVVGGNLVRSLLDNDIDVRVLVRPGSDVSALRLLPIEYREGDVLDGRSLVGLAVDCDWVFHAAAVFSYSGLSESELNHLAVRGTQNVLTAAAHADVERVVLTSSSVTLGSGTSPDVRDEQDSIEEKYPSAYTMSKIRQEQAAFETAGELDLDLVAVCPGLTVGAHDFRLSPSNASIVNYLNDPIRFTFPGGCNIVSARDVAAGHLIAARFGASGTRYVAGGENLLWRDVHAQISRLGGTFGPTVMLNNTTSYLAAAGAEMSAKLMGKPPSVTRDEGIMACRFYWYSSAALTQLGYAPDTAETALTEALAWLIHRSYLTESVIDRLEPVDEVHHWMDRFRGVAA